VAGGARRVVAFGSATEAVTVRSGANSRGHGAAFKAPLRPPLSVATVGGGVLTPPAGAAVTRVAAMKVASLSRCVDKASCAAAAYRRSASTVAPVVALLPAPTRES